METPPVELLICDICSAALLPNPLYDESVSKYCRRHGDYFVIRLRGQKPIVVFVPFQKTVKKSTERKPHLPPQRSKKSPERKPHVPAQRLKKSPESRPYVPVLRPKARAGHPGINVRCNQTGVIFASITEAAKAMHLDATSICNVIRGKQRAANGYTFSKVEDAVDEPFVPVPRLEPRFVNRGGAKQPIRCNQTDQIFESVRHAARTLGLRPTNISKQINGHQRTVEGYTFAKVLGD